MSSRDDHASTGWALRERYSCDADECDQDVVCIFDGEEHYQDGATGYSNENGLFTFCRAHADAPFTTAQEVEANV